MKLAMRYGLAALLIVVAIILLVPPFAGSLIEQWSESDVKSRSVLAFNSSLDEFTSLLDDRNAKGNRRAVRENGAGRGIAGGRVLRRSGRLALQDQGDAEKLHLQRSDVAQGADVFHRTSWPPAIAAVELSDRPDRRTRPCRAGA